ncbi:MAG: imidazole glycerol phosphate synthase subunit HisH [Chitinophagaceae bacterium]|nr:imidazole glycerol phosphate synthase subunit HisH [Chitinophagaceae bacterium]
MTVIVDYGLGNLASVLNMHRYLGIEACISQDKEVIEKADRLILPGVGNFKKGMENLEGSGLKSVLNKLVLDKGVPVLGLCLGAQLMTRHSEEGDVDGLGWIDADTVSFDQARLGGLKVPHMGWADVKLVDGNPLWAGMYDAPRFYHVHSYHFKLNDESLKSATAVYGYEFTCAFHHKNIYGVQFHPEKSHKYGMKVLENFSKLN